MDRNQRKTGRNKKAPGSQKPGHLWASRCKKSGPVSSGYGILDQPDDVCPCIITQLEWKFWVGESGSNIYPLARKGRSPWPVVFYGWWGGGFPSVDIWYCLKIFWGIGRLLQLGMLLNSLQCTAKPHMTKKPPAPNISSVKVEKPWSWLMGPTGIEKGYFLNRKLRCVEDMIPDSSTQIPLNPFGQFLFSLPSLCFFQLLPASSFKGQFLGCWSHL